MVSVIQFYTTSFYSAGKKFFFTFWSNLSDIFLKVWWLANNFPVSVQYFSVTIYKYFVAEQEEAGPTGDVRARHNGIKSTSFSSSLHLPHSAEEI